MPSPATLTNSNQFIRFRAVGGDKRLDSRDLAAPETRVNDFRSHFNLSQCYLGDRPTYNSELSPNQGQWSLSLGKIKIWFRITNNKALQVGVLVKSLVGPCRMRLCPTTSGLCQLFIMNEKQFLKTRVRQVLVLHSLAV